MKKLLISVFALGLFLLLISGPASIGRVTQASDNNDDDCTPAPSGLVSWWPGEGNANDIIDGNSATQTLGAPQFEAAKVAQGFKFDGDDGFIVPDNANLNFGANDSFTIDAWVRVDGQSPTSVGEDALLDKRANAPSFTGQRGYALTVVHPGHPSNLAAEPVIFFVIAEDNSFPAKVAYIFSSPFTYNQLHLVAVVVDRVTQTVSIYLDGILQQQTSIATVGDISNSARLFIGHHSLDLFTGVRPFNGMLDEIEIFNRALSALEIQAIYNAGSAGKCKDADGDGVNDGEDNCPTTPNPDQADFDLDGEGDACDAETGPPQFEDQCKNGGWQRFDFPRTFKNQGDCIQFVNTGK